MGNLNNCFCQDRSEESKRTQSLFRQAEIIISPQNIMTKNEYEVNFFNSSLVKMTILKHQLSVNLCDTYALDWEMKKMAQYKGLFKYLKDQVEIQKVIIYINDDLEKNINYQNRQISAMIFFQALLEIDIDRHIQIKITHPKVQVLKPFFDQSTKIQQDLIKLAKEQGPPKITNRVSDLEILNKLQKYGSQTKIQSEPQEEEQCKQQQQQQQQQQQEQELEQQLQFNDQQVHDYVTYRLCEPL